MSEAGLSGENHATGTGSGVFAELGNAFESAREGLAALLELMLLEARRASLSLVWMLIAGLLAAMCLIATWLGLAAVAAMWMISGGMSPMTAVLAVVVANLLAAVVFVLACIRMSRNLLFSATRRQIVGESRPGDPGS